MIGVRSFTASSTVTLGDANRLSRLPSYLAPR
jgi:hypothetical protein